MSDLDVHAREMEENAEHEEYVERAFNVTVPAENGSTLVIVVQGTHYRTEAAETGDDLLLIVSMQQDEDDSYDVATFRRWLNIAEKQP
jgi:hypothetical protein